MALGIGHSQVKVMHHYIQDSSILTLSYPGSRVDQLWSKLEDTAIIIIILSPGCQQPFWSKMAGDNRLSAATSFYSPGSDKLTEVQLFMSNSCQ